MAPYKGQVADTVYALTKLLKERVPDKKQLELSIPDGKDEMTFKLKTGARWVATIHRHEFNIGRDDKGALMVQWYVSLSILLGCYTSR